MKFTIIIFTTSLLIGAVALTFLNYNLETEIQQEVASEEIVEEVPQFEEPFCTVAIHSASRLQKDMDYMFSLASLGKKETKQIKAEMREFLDYMQAVDSDRPAASMFWQTERESDDLDDLFCFPVTDIKKFTRMLKDYGKVTECALGWVYKPNDGKKKLMCHDGDYLYVSHKKERLKKILPTDLDRTLRTLIGDNTAVAKIDVSKIPQDDRSKALDFLKDGPNEFLGLDESQYMAVTEKWATNLLQDTEQVVVSLNIDKDSKRIELGSRLIAAEGSPTALEANKSLSLKSNRFADFRADKNSFARIHLQSANLEECLRAIQADAERSIELAKNENETKEAPALTKNLSDKFPIPGLADKIEEMIDGTIESGNVEFAANCYFDGSVLNMLMAFRVPDTTLLAELIQLRESGEFPLGDSEKTENGFKGIEKDEDLTMLILDNPKNAELFEGLPFDNSPHGIVAFDKEAIYIASGKKGKERLLQFVNDNRKMPAETRCQSGFEMNLGKAIKQMMPPFIYAEFKSELKDGDEIAFYIEPTENGYEGSASFDLALLSLGKAMSNGLPGGMPQASKSFRDVSRKNASTARVRSGRQSAGKSVKGFSPVSSSLSGMDKKAQREFQKGFEKGLKNSLESRATSKSVKQNNATGSRISNPFASGSPSQK